jgi:hypothetical protein
MQPDNEPHSLIGSIETIETFVWLGTDMDKPIAKLVVHCNLKQTLPSVYWTSTLLEQGKAELRTRV